MIETLGIDGFTASCHKTMSSIVAADWDACGTADYPLLQHRHLLILEECGLAVPAAGFHPHHLVLRRPDGMVVGAAPAYLKTSSQGELGVDLGLSLAHQRAVGPYYPKLQVEVPMVPNPGPRLLVRPGADAGRVRAALLGALRETARRAGAASVQIAYMTAQDQQAATALGFLPSEGNVFVWHDRGMADFEEFVALMGGHARRQVRKDRRRAAALGLRFEVLEGDAITPDLAPAMFDFYKSTYDRYDTTPGLNRGYFTSLFTRMPDVVTLLVACQDESWQAAGLCITGRDRLYAQYWGLAAPQENLIFEMFYREMEHAFARDLGSIDFGSGGRHKAPRGIGIEAARHALWFRDQEFASLAATACTRKRAVAAAERATELERMPFPVANPGGTA